MRFAACTGGLATCLMWALARGSTEVTQAMVPHKVHQDSIGLC